jgi:hypothetical protein
MTRYAAKKDTNHGEIQKGLKDTFGPDAVQDVSMYPRLGFDLIAIARGRVMFLEVKQPKKVTHLTESEQEARARYGDYWRVVTTLEEALEAMEAPAP